MKDTSSTQHLKAGGPGNNAVSSSGAAALPTGRSESVPKLPDFRELLSPAQPRSSRPKSGPNKGQPKVSDPGEAPTTDSNKPVPPPVSAKRPTFTVRRGDTYESIARELFGSRALQTEISRLNPRQDPRRLIPGKKILMPTQDEVDAFMAKRVAKQSGVEVGGKYKIVKGDTLIGIAKRKLGAERRVAEIQALNPGLDPANLKIGVSIRLPKK